MTKKIFSRSPMPSRPNMKAPEPPSNAKPVSLNPVASLSGKTANTSMKYALSCSAIAFIFLLIIALACIYVLARMGIISLPGFQWARVHVEPTYTLSREYSETTEDLIHRVQTDIVRQLQTGTSTVTVAFSDQDLTQIAEPYIEQIVQDQGMQVKNEQVIILEDRLEFFGQLYKDDKTVDVLIQAIPTITQSGTVQLDVLRANIGTFPVSPALLGVIEQEMSLPLVYPALQQEYALQAEDIRFEDNQLSVVASIEQ